MDTVREVVKAANKIEANPMEKANAMGEIADILSNCDGESFEKALAALGYGRNNGNGKSEK